MKTLEKLLAEKINENQNLIEKNEMYIRVLRDLDGGETPAKPHRRSTIRRAADIIKQAGRPMHADEILVKLGKKKTRRNKVSLSSSMTHYANEEKLFKKTEPNTFDVLQ